VASAQSPLQQRDHGCSFGLQAAPILNRLRHLHPRTTSHVDADVRAGARFCFSAAATQSGSPGSGFPGGDTAAVSTRR
jgi:hypothetical protein